MPGGGVGLGALRRAVHARGRVLREALPEVAAPRWDGAHQDHAPHVIGVRDGIRRGQQRPVRVRNERDTIQMKVQPHRLKIRDLLCGRELQRVGGQRGPPRAALIVKNHDMMFAQRREVASDALEINTGATVNSHERVRALPHHAEEQPRPVRCGDVPLVRGRRRAHRRPLRGERDGGEGGSDGGGECGRENTLSERHHVSPAEWNDACTRLRERKQFARIHQIPWVERVLDTAHGIDGITVFLRQRTDLSHADPVFAGAGAAQA